MQFGPGYRRVRWTLLPLFGMGFSAWATACLSDANQGIDPPLDRLGFSAGVVLDPRPMGLPGEGAACDPGDDAASCADGLACVQNVCTAPSPYLYVVNANSDRTYNGSVIVAFDLNKFFDATTLDGLASVDSSYQLGAADQELRAETPCRRSSFTREVIECEETFFAIPDAGAVAGQFAGHPAVWTPPGEAPKIVLPVRGDPSLTILEMQGGTLADPRPHRLSCSASGDEEEFERCSRAARLRFLRDQDGSTRLPLNPRGVVVAGDLERPLAFAVHGNTSFVTAVGLRGRAPAEPSTDVNVDITKPQILDIAPFLISGRVEVGVSGREGAPGGAELAVRPCVPTQQGGTPPLASQNCTRPLVYASYRSRARIAVFTASSPLITPNSGQKCVLAEELGFVSGGVLCDELLQPLWAFESGGPRLGGTATGANYYAGDGLGALKFSKNGDELYILQRDPGALLRIDTSLNEQTLVPHDRFSYGVDVCRDATDFEIYRGPSGRYGLVSCRDSASVYVVDLAALNVLKIVALGTSPSVMVSDPVREVVYVPNFLDATVSVLDMSVQRSTRFSEIARLGLPEVIE